jgi:hypothetical protein
MERIRDSGMNKKKKSSAFMPGRRLALAGLLLLFSLVYTASLEAADDDDYAPDLGQRVAIKAANGKTFNVGYTLDSGNMIIHVSLPEIYSYTVVQRVVSGSQAFFPNTPTTAVQGLFAYSPPNVIVKNPELNLMIVLTDSVSSSTGSINPNYIGDEIRAQTTEITFPISSFLTNQTIHLICFKGNGSYVKVSFTLACEFFKGENELRLGHMTVGGQNVTYEQHAAAFLYTFFKATPTVESRFKESIRNLKGAAFNPASAFWEIYTNTPNLETYQKAFRRSFGYHFFKDASQYGVNTSGTNWKNVAVPYLLGGPDSFKAIYGNEKNIYAEAYLFFINDNNDSADIAIDKKPVLSASVNANIRRVKGDYAYNYKQYSNTINEAEGQELAKAALRYISWGVEYSLDGLRRNDADVEKIFRIERQTIEKWVKEKEATQTAGKNYLPQGIPIPEYDDALLQGTVQPLLKLTSPFSGKGCPIPYAENGIDSPRVFAYKMLEQVKARQWYFGKARTSNETNRLVLYGSAAVSDSWKGGYVDEFDLYRLVNGKKLEYAAGYPTGYFILAGGKNSTAYTGSALEPFASQSDNVKPFLPGMPSDAVLTSRNGNSQYSVDKLAGADSIGILMGSISMTGFSNWIYDANNTLPAVNVDAYTKMTVPVSGVPLPGMGADGYPAFYRNSSEQDSVNNGIYRFNKTDLERATIQITDIGAARAGDILVRMNQEKPLVAIVVAVKTQASPSDITKSRREMGKLIVVSTSPEAGKAFLSSWTNSTYFPEPEQYQLRRLVKKTDNTAPIAYVSDSWELLDDSLIGLNVDMKFEKSDDNPWVPNTGEPKFIREITIKKEGLAGNTNHLKQGTKVRLLGPKDRRYQVIAGDTSNIYVNKGYGLEFTAQKTKDAEPKILATFKIVANSDTYAIDESSPYFSSDGRPKNGCKFYTDNTGILTVEVGNVRYVSFGIRPATPSADKKICPGDDFLLRFGVMMTDGEGEEGLSIGVAQEQDYLAIYDKKMLWRANLYIDESGANDWNHTNPWKAPASGGITNITPKWWTPEWGYNEWNHDQGSIYEGNGEQIPIKSWTRYYLAGTNSNFSNTTRIVNGSVAYTTGGSDSPFQFNLEMNNQMNCLNISKQGGWSQTIAPETTLSDWINYDLTIRSSNGTSFYPYRPGLSAKHRYSDPNTYNAEQVKASSGADCSGFIQKTASYNGNIYVLDDLTVEDTWSSGQASALLEGFSDFPRGFGNKSVLISDETLDWAYQPENLQLVVPGDFIYLKAEGKQHVAMIQKITRPMEGAEITRDNVYVIHATSGRGLTWKINVNDKWENDLLSDPPSDIWYKIGNKFQVRRLKCLP